MPGVSEALAQPTWCVKLTEFPAAYAGGFGTSAVRDLAHE
jgi:hypothetical protein